MATAWPQSQAVLSDTPKSGIWDRPCLEGHGQVSAQGCDPASWVCPSSTGRVSEPHSQPPLLRICPFASSPAPGAAVSAPGRKHQNGEETEAVPWLDPPGSSATTGDVQVRRFPCPKVPCPLVWFMLGLAASPDLGARLRCFFTPCHLHQTVVSPHSPRGFPHNVLFCSQQHL